MKQKFKNGFIKYGITILLVIGFLVLDICLKCFYDKCFYYKLNKNDDVLNIMIQLISVITSIIVISLSLTKEKIYSLPSFAFRRMRKDIHFSIFEMILIIGCIFILFSISSFFKLKIFGYFLDFLSIAYAFAFVYQEIPLLTNNDKKISKIISKNFKINDALGFKEGNLSKDANLDKVITYSILNKGIKETYLMLKKDNSSNGLDILYYLLTLNNDYLQEKVSEKISESEANIEINNLKELLYDNDDFYFIKGNDKNKCLNQIVNFIFILKNGKQFKKYSERVEKELSLIFSNLRSKVFYQTIPGKDFKYKLLIKLLIKSISENSLWFVQLLLESEFWDFNISEFTSKIISTFKANDCNFFVYISIYLFYFLKFNKQASFEIKSKIKELLKVKSNNIFLKLFNKIYDIYFLNEYLVLLNDLLYFRDLNDDFFEFFKTNERNNRNGIKIDFSYNIILKCWFALLSNRTSEFFFEEFKIDINRIKNDDHKYRLYNFFKKEKIANLTKETLLSKFISVDYLKTLSIKEINIKMINNNFICSIKQLEQNLGSYLKNYKITNRTDSKYKSEFKNILNKTADFANKFGIIHKDLDLSNKEIRVFRYLISKNNNSSYSLNEFLYQLQYNIISIFNKNYETKHIKTNDEENLSKLNGTINNLTGYYKTKGISGLFIVDRDEEFKSKIKLIPEIDVTLKDIVFFKEGGIMFDFKCNEENTFIRSLNDDEINDLIENNYKVGNNLYKFYDNGINNIFISRNEIYKIIKDQFYVLNFAYQYNLEINEKEIIIFENYFYSNN